VREGRLQAGPPEGELAQPAVRLFVERIGRQGGLVLALGLGLFGCFFGRVQRLVQCDGSRNVSLADHLVRHELMHAGGFRSREGHGQQGLARCSTTSFGAGRRV
jgi:hypothetical protein